MADSSKDEQQDMRQTEARVGLGILAGAAVAIGAAAAYLYGTEAGRRHRRFLTKWMADMRSELVNRLQDLQYVDRDTYYEVIDGMVERYKDVDEVDAQELLDFAADLKHHYSTITREIEEGKTSSKGKKGGSKKSSSGSKKASTNSTKSSSSKKSTSSSTKKKSS